MNIDLKPYPDYKDSGLEWLGSIPVHWDILRCKYVFREVDDRSEAGEETHLSMSQQYGLVPSSKFSERRLYSETYAGGKLCQVNDLVLNRLKAHLGVFAHAREPGVVSPDYTVLRPLLGDDVVFFELVFKTPLYIAELRRSTKGIVEGFWRLYTDDFYNIRVPVPPPQDREAILRFIRAFDSKVQRFLRSRRQLILVLNQQKQAIIKRAVIRGLDPNVPLKPSGIDWLGDIPEHWEVLRGKYLFREIDLRSGTGDEIHLSMSQRHGLIRSSDISERRLMSDSYVGGKLCDKDDLVLNRLKAHLGVFALAPESGLVSPDYTVFRATRSICLPFYEYLYRTPLYCAEYRKRVKGIVQGFWRLYTDDFYDIPVPFPPISEQEMIVRRLTQDLSRTDAAIERAYQEIDLVHEYRTRLLADVVTGKIDVRGLAPSSGDEEIEFKLEELDQVNDVDGILGDDEPTLVEEAADAGD